jgi:hypothetical protein
MTTVSKLPIWLSGDLSEFLYENEANASIAFPKKIKTTLEFAGLRDILEMIDIRHDDRDRRFLPDGRVPFAFKKLENTVPVPDPICTYSKLGEVI